MRIFLAIIFIIVLIPFYFMVIGSIQDVYGIMAMPPRLIPKDLTIENYTIFFGNRFLIYTMNTVIVASCDIIASALVSCMTGYCFAFFKFPFKRALWLLILFGIMIPPIALIIPKFVVIKDIGLSGTLAAVILPCILAPPSIYLARCYFESLPFSLLESARMDGANEWQILTKVAAPLSKSLIAALLIFASIGILNDYLWQMLCLMDAEKQTLVVGLMKEVRRSTVVYDMKMNPFGKSMASGIILFIPILVIFLFGNKYFTSSLQGGVKE